MARQIVVAQWPDVSIEGLRMWKNLQQKVIESPQRIGQAWMNSTHHHCMPEVSHAKCEKGTNLFNTKGSRLASVGRSLERCDGAEDER